MFSGGRVLCTLQTSKLVVFHGLHSELIAPQLIKLKVELVSRERGCGFERRNIILGGSWLN